MVKNQLKIFGEVKERKPEMYVKELFSVGCDAMHVRTQCVIG